MIPDLLKIRYRTSSESPPPPSSTTVTSLNPRRGKVFPSFSFNWFSLDPKENRSTRTKTQTCGWFISLTVTFGKHFRNLVQRWSMGLLLIVKFHMSRAVGFLQCLDPLGNQQREVGCVWRERCLNTEHSSVLLCTLHALPENPSISHVMIKKENERMKRKRKWGRDRGMEGEGMLERTYFCLKCSSTLVNGDRSL